MSGISGIVSLQKKLLHETENIRRMTNSLTKRGGTQVKTKIEDYGLFGCTSLDYLQNKEIQIPFSLKINDVEYTVCFDGLLYNSDDIRTELKKRGIKTESTNDAELTLLAYTRWGAGCLNRMNGIFAFSVWNSKTRELFMARDRFGIKPLYYANKNELLIFASEIKGILAHSEIDAVLDKTGICEVMGLGPAQTQGNGIFENIREVLPAHFVVYNKNGFNEHRYWALESKEFNCDFDECLAETKKRVFNALDIQLNEKGRRTAFFLSGGVDSSAITAYAAKKLGRQIDTFSLEYSGNDEYFVPTEYQPASDGYFIDLVSNQYNTKHHIVTVDNETLLEHLTDAVDCRDVPGMADVDSSLYFLCKNMGKEFNGAFSGECADEIFGGYPWFHRQEDFNAKVFPWAKNIELRKELISPELMAGDVVEEYIYSSYNRSIAETPICPYDTAEEKRRREISYLNLNWFMYTLGARSERIGMNCGLEIRMPFCDYKLVEYVWNVPWKYKAYKNREKGLLRCIFEDFLPEEVLWRKKSPFPKTHNPEYEKLVKERVMEIFEDKNSPIHELVNKQYILQIMNIPSDYGKPWFGQLMALPQLYAYIIQLEYWLKQYKIKIKI